MRSLPVSRRGFLKATTGVAVSAPYIIPCSALGTETLQPPSERVTLGHIGVGNRGSDLQNRFQQLPQAQSVAVADPYRSRREERAAAIDKGYAGDRSRGSYKGCAAYSDFRELLSRDDIDAVIIATPDHWHVPAAIAAIRAGKDVYVEKPLGVSFEEDKLLRERVREHKAVFQYGTQQRSDQKFRFACELARNGRLGKVHTIHVWCTLGGTGGSTEAVPVPEDLDYNLWLGPAPLAPYTADRCVTPGVYWVYDYSLGYVAGWGVHPLDIAQWGNDADHTSPSEYEGTGIIPSEGLYNTIYTWDMTLKYENGVVVRYVSSDRVRPLIESYRGPHDHGTTFIGDKGWVSVDRGGIYAEPKSLLDTVIGPDEVHLYESDNHYANFVDCVRNRKKPISSIESAVRVDTASQLCDISIRLGRKIRWDPKEEKILGDPEAEKMLSRPLRAPWTL